MKNISDVLHNYIEDIELTEEEAQYLSEYIDYIVKNTEPIYELLDHAKKDDQKANELIKLLNIVVKGEE